MVGPNNRKPGGPAPQPAWLADLQHQVDAAISAHLNHLKTLHPDRARLIQAVEYSMIRGGKRLRPILVLVCAKLLAGAASASGAMPLAIALECVHTFSLIHDDLPAMDNDDLRRGHPTNHRVFGEAHAILAGDWLVAHAFELVASGAPPDRAAAAVVALASATGDMILGQSFDIEGESQPASAVLVEQIHARKTARLLEASCRLGALAASATPHDVERLARFGRHLGLAFQIIDDLLDASTSSEILGKTAGKDAAANKQTFPAVYGVEESRRRAHAEISAALEELTTYGSAADDLRELARYITSRDR